MKWQGLKTLPFHYASLKSVRTIQAFDLLSQDVRLLAQDISDASAKGGGDEGTENLPNGTV
jgi:hypothetical protein